MESRVWKEFLGDKKNSGSRIKVYLSEKTQSFKNSDGTNEIARVGGVMLQGKILDFDDSSLRLRDQECLIERNNIVSIK